MNSVNDRSHWSQLQRHTLANYDEALLRQVAARLVKPRNQWPAADLIERSVAAASNPVLIDRRLQDLTPAARRVLALLGHSRQVCWNLGNLVELTIALGHGDGLQPLLELLDAGMLYPNLIGTQRIPSANGVFLSGQSALAPRGQLKSFEQWLAAPGPGGLLVFAPPTIAARAVGEDLGLPDLSVMEPNRGQEEADTAAPSLSRFRWMEADGLEWLLRLAVLWQKATVAPLRRTQQGEFFKRDFERLAQDPLLNTEPPDRLTDVPDRAFLTVAWAEQQGILTDRDGELRAGQLPPAWDEGLAAALELLWTGLFQLTTWNPLDGWRGNQGQIGNPFPSAYLLAFLLLARLPEEAWVRPESLEQWIMCQHPYWTNESLRPSRQKPWLKTFLLGLAYPLRLVQVKCTNRRDTSPTERPTDQRGTVPTEEQVRLSPIGRWLLGLSETPTLESVHTQTLLVQPNLQIIAYRQGLTSSLIARLTQFASWEGLGPACTLQLQPETVYRALEAGQSFESIRLTLEQHSSRSVPPTVLDSLRTWANKRDRITVYPSATLLEFGSAEELNEALARGLAVVRLSDCLAVTANEETIDFRHFRLTGTRDYALPPEKCVQVEADGVTLSVDGARSDLLLETELPRFAEPINHAPTDRRNDGPTGRRQYRLTPASLKAARAAGITQTVLETWFRQRTGQPLSPAARLLMAAGEVKAPYLQRHLVLHVADEETADGLMQWPQTRECIEARLGPTTLVVAEENVPLLRERLRNAGIELPEREA